MSIDDAKAKEIAQNLNDGLNEFFATDSAGKAKVLKHWLDEQIGTEPHAQITSIPGMPLLSGAMLETISDVMLDAVANALAKKLGG